MPGSSASGWASLVGIILLLGGLQLLCLGIVGKYIGKIYLQSKNLPIYSEREKIALLEDIDLRIDTEKLNKQIFYITVKRFFDILACVVGLVILSPLFLVIAICIKVEDPRGPVFYSQERVGKNEKHFKMFKFRSMVTNADQLLQDLKDRNEVNGAMFKLKNDPRITKVGRIIRKYSLDELPQLLNVVIGSMSLVGPRPPLVGEVAQYSDYDKQRLLVKPGCTGLWQVGGRNDVDFPEMVRLDLSYINNRSIYYDLKIILKTFLIIIKPNGAY